MNRDEIPAFRLRLEPLGSEAEALMQRPAYVDPSIGERSRLGGTPDSIQDMPWPTCSGCGQDLTFYAQLDGLPGGYDLADAGLIHVFVCFDCFEVHARLDSA